MATFHMNEVELQSKINIPIVEAENFKNSWPRLTCIVDDNDWCFVENGLCPTLVIMIDSKDNSKYKFPLSVKNQSEIFYSFDEFEIANPYLNAVVFKYSETK